MARNNKKYIEGCDLATEFTERMRKVQEKAGVTLRRVQEEIKDLVFNKRLVKKVDREIYGIVCG